MSGKKWVGRTGFCFQLKTTKVHIWTAIMFRQHRFCIYKGNRKLKLLIVCENFDIFFVLFVPDYQFVFCCYYFFENVEKSL